VWVTQGERQTTKIGTTVTWQVFTVVCAANTFCNMCTDYISVLNWIEQWEPWRCIQALKFPGILNIHQIPNNRREYSSRRTSHPAQGLPSANEQLLYKTFIETQSDRFLSRFVMTGWALGYVSTLCNCTRDSWKREAEMKEKNWKSFYLKVLSHLRDWEKSQKVTLEIRLWYPQIPSQTRYDCDNRLVCFLMPTARSSVLLERLIVAQLIKFPASHGTQISVTVFMKSRHWSISWARWIQSTLLVLSYFLQGSTLILSSHLSLCLPKWQICLVNEDGWLL
jgi:hypothetical protein